jgi:trans-aconitate methyltransferase
MADQEARYDRIAEGYSACWSPIHRTKTLGLLDVIEQAVAAGARRILDVGCGTGALAAAAVARWPDVHVTGVDPSSGMLLVADRELEPLPPAQRSRSACRSSSGRSTS